MNVLELELARTSPIDALCAALVSVWSLHIVVYLTMTYIALAAGTRPIAPVFAASPLSYHLAAHSLHFDKTVRSSLENMLMVVPVGLWDNTNLK